MQEHHLPQELLQAIQDGAFAVLGEEECDASNRILVRHFPFSGSFVDWAATKNARKVTEDCAASQGKCLKGFFAGCVGHRGGDLAYYRNDGVAGGLRASVATFSEHIEAFVDILHTGYFIAADGAWCLSLRMSGQMDYGESRIP
jgi:hypothetical protein